MGGAADEVPPRSSRSPAVGLTRPAAEVRHRTGWLTQARAQLHSSSHGPPMHHLPQASATTSRPTHGGPGLPGGTGPSPRFAKPGHRCRTLRAAARRPHPRPRSGQGGVGSHDLTRRRSGTRSPQAGRAPTRPRAERRCGPRSRAVAAETVVCLPPPARIRQDSELLTRHPAPDLQREQIGVLVTQHRPAVRRQLHPHRQV
jgi:hypothetical protein